MECVIGLNIVLTLEKITATLALWGMESCGQQIAVGGEFRSFIEIDFRGVASLLDALNYTTTGSFDLRSRVVHPSFEVQSKKKKKYKVIQID